MEDRGLRVRFISSAFSATVCGPRTGDAYGREWCKTYLFGEKSRNEIYKAISTNPRMPIKLDMLERYGIVKTVEGGTVTCKRLITLTPLGHKYAEAIANLERSTGGSIDVFKWDLMRSMMDEMCKIEA